MTSKSFSQIAKEMAISLEVFQLIDKYEADDIDTKDVLYNVLVPILCRVDDAAPNPVEAVDFMKKCYMKARSVNKSLKNINHEES